MITRIVIFICAVSMMSACCGSSSSQKCESKKACCSEGAGCQAPAGNSADVKKIISARIFVKPEKIDEFLAAAKEVIEKSRAEAGCVSYGLFQDPFDRSQFLFFEEWQNQAAIDYHFATEHFKKFGEALDNCASKPAIITIHDSASETTL